MVQEYYMPDITDSWKRSKTSLFLFLINSKKNYDLYAFAISIMDDEALSFLSCFHFISFRVTLQPPLVTEFYQLIETINHSENSFMSVKQSTGWL